MGPFFRLRFLGIEADLAHSLFVALSSRFEVFAALDDLEEEPPLALSIILKFAYAGQDRTRSATDSTCVQNSRFS